MAEDNAVVLRLDAVHKQYESADRDPVPVLKGITLTVNRGESIAIVGPSGSGKSTLLNILGSLDSPTNGSIQLDGLELAHLTEQDLASVRNKKIGFIFNRTTLPQCSVLETCSCRRSQKTVSAGRRSPARETVARSSRAWPPAHPPPSPALRRRMPAGRRGACTDQSTQPHPRRRTHRRT